MTLNPTNPRAKPRWLLAIGAVGAMTVLVAGIVLATGPVGTANGFEDDDGNLAPAAPINFDWNSFASTTWTGTAPYRVADKSFAGFTFKGIEDAQATTSDTAFAGGTKQDDNCATVNSGKAPNKDDLKRIYLASNVASVEDPVGSGVYKAHTFLDLAWVRIPQNTTSASAHVGFEFNRGTDGPCGGSSDGLVKRVAGDMLIVYDFEGGTADPVITLRRWVTSGSCEIGSDSPPCWGTATNLTAGGFAEAKVNVGSSVSDNIAPTPPDTLNDSEFGEAGIDLTGAGVFGAGTCASFGTAFGVSRSSGNSGQAQMKDLVGPADFTLANCGTVITRKVTDPSGDTTTSFGYTTNVTTTPSTTTSPFSLKDGESNTISNVNPGSSLNVTEDDPGTNYSLESIDCSASSVPGANYSTSTVTRAVTFSIAAGETLDCTFTNKLQQGAIQVHKTDSKTGDDLAGAKFDVKDASDVTVGQLTTDANGLACVDGLAFGDYTVKETDAPTGYVIDDTTAESVTVDNNAACDDSTYVGETISFTDTPTSDIQVNFRDGGSGVTSATISCDNSTGSTSSTAATGWDTTKTITGIEAPTTIHCTITIDP